MNFYDLLYSSISADTKEDNETTSKDGDGDDGDDICLISYDKLEPQYITLLCGHKFNYEPLFNEIYNQKHVQNYLETKRVAKHQLKCPYCRNVQNKILPPKENFQKSIYVNYPLKYCMLPNKCTYAYRSGVKKGTLCNRPCIVKCCKAHLQYCNPKPLTKKQTEKMELKSKIVVLRNNIKDITSFLRSEIICKEEKCKNKCVGDLETCYRHGSKSDKEKIKMKREEKKSLNQQCKEIRQQINNL